MKKPKIYHFGTVNQGKLKLDDRPRFQVALNGLEGKEVRLTIEKKPAQRKQRSVQQNNYYWGVVIPLAAAHTGYSEDEMHDAFRIKFLSGGDNPKLPTVKSTTELSTVEYEEYLAEIRMMMSLDFNCPIPKPNEVEF